MSDADDGDFLSKVWTDDFQVLYNLFKASSSELWLVPTYRVVAESRRVGVSTALFQLLTRYIAEFEASVTEARWTRWKTVMTTTENHHKQQRPPQQLVKIVVYFMDRKLASAFINNLTKQFPGSFKRDKADESVLYGCDDQLCIIANPFQFNANDRGNNNKICDDNADGDTGIPIVHGSRLIQIDERHFRWTTPEEEALMREVDRQTRNHAIKTRPPVFFKAPDYLIVDNAGFANQTALTLFLQQKEHAATARWLFGDKHRTPNVSESITFLLSRSDNGGFQCKLVK